jgi:hypothetical protein
MFNARVGFRSPTWGVGEDGARTFMLYFHADGPSAVVRQMAITVFGRTLNTHRGPQRPTCGPPDTWSVLWPTFWTVTANFHRDMEVAVCLPCYRSLFAGKLSEYAPRHCLAACKIRISPRGPLRRDVTVYQFGQLAGHPVIGLEPTHPPSCRSPHRIARYWRSIHSITSYEVAVPRRKPKGIMANDVNIKSCIFTRLNAMFI